MLKDFIWGAFENTGNIEYYLFYKQLRTSSSEEKRIPEIGADEEEKSAAGNQ